MADEQISLKEYRNIIANLKEYGRPYISYGGDEYSKLIFQTVDENWSPRIITTGGSNNWLINPVGNTVVSRRVKGVIPKEYLEDFVKDWKDKYCASQVTKDMSKSITISYKNIMLSNCYLISLEITETPGRIPTFSMGIVSEKETFDPNIGQIPLPEEYELNRDMLSENSKAIISSNNDDRFDTFSLIGVSRVYKDKVSIVEVENKNIRLMAFGLSPCKYTLTLNVPEYIDDENFPYTTIINNFKDKWLVRRGGNLITVSYGSKTIVGAVISVVGRNTTMNSINITIEMIISNEKHSAPQIEVIEEEEDV